MTYEEAIYALINAPFLATENSFEEIEEAVRIAWKALEKQIPKKPTLEYSDNVSKKVFGGVCECGTTLSMNYKHCPDCGQAIDWSDEE